MEGLPEDLKQELHEQLLEGYTVMPLDGEDSLLWLVWMSDLQWAVLFQWYPVSEEWDRVNLPPNSAKSFLDAHRRLSGDDQ